MQKYEKKMEKRIVVGYGVVKRLVDEGWGSKPTVISALRCQRDTAKARSIRQRAMQLGGVLMKSEHATEKTTTE